MDLYLYIGLFFNVQLTPNECEVLSHHEFDLHSPVGSDSKESACKAGDRVQSLGQEGPPEEGVAPHSSILAWEIPWTEEPGRLQYVG